MGDLAQLAECERTILLTSMFCSCSIRCMSLIDILLRASPIASLIAVFSASLIFDLLSVSSLPVLQASCVYLKSALTADVESAPPTQHVQGQCVPTITKVNVLTP